MRTSSHHQHYQEDEDVYYWEDQVSLQRNPKPSSYQVDTRRISFRGDSRERYYEDDYQVERGADRRQDSQSQGRGEDLNHWEAFDYYPNSEGRSRRVDGGLIIVHNQLDSSHARDYAEPSYRQHQYDGERRAGEEMEPVRSIRTDDYLDDPYDHHERRRLDGEGFYSNGDYPSKLARAREETTATSRARGTSTAARVRETSPSARVRESTTSARVRETSPSARVRETSTSARVRETSDTRGGKRAERSKGHREGRARSPSPRRTAATSHVKKQDKAPEFDLQAPCEHHSRGKDLPSWMKSRDYHTNGECRSSGRPEALRKLQEAEELLKAGYRRSTTEKVPARISSESGKEVRKEPRSFSSRHSSGAASSRHHASSKDVKDAKDSRRDAVVQEDKSQKRKAREPEVPATARQPQQEKKLSSEPQKSSATATKPIAAGLDLLSQPLQAGRSKHGLKAKESSSSKKKGFDGETPRHAAAVKEASSHSSKSNGASSKPVGTEHKTEGDAAPSSAKKQKIEIDPTAVAQPLDEIEIGGVTYALVPKSRAPTSSHGAGPPSHRAGPASGEAGPASRGAGPLSNGAGPPSDAITSANFNTVNFKSLTRREKESSAPLSAVATMPPYTTSIHMPFCDRSGCQSHAESSQDEHMGSEQGTVVDCSPAAAQGEETHLANNTMTSTEDDMKVDDQQS